MWFITTLRSWGSSAWHFLAGLPGDVGGALQHLWHYITSVHDLLAYLASTPILTALRGVADVLDGYLRLISTLTDAVDRIGWWVYWELLEPAVLYLLGVIAQLRAWTQAQVRRLDARITWVYLTLRAFTLQQVGIERADRIKDVQAARAYAHKLVLWALQTVQDEAASGYSGGVRARLSTLNKLLDELAARNPVIRGLTADLIKGILGLLGAENPVARLVLTFLLTRVVNSLGIDKAAGELLQRLLGPLAGSPHPKTLHDVIRDLDQRATALEEQWADFMAKGGPQVEQAGSDWKNVTALTADAALLGFFGLAVADPGAWARDVSASLGAAVNDAIIGTEQLIRRA